VIKEFKRVKISSGKIGEKKYGGFQCIERGKSKKKEKMQF